MDSVKKDEPGY